MKLALSILRRAIFGDSTLGGPFDALLLEDGASGYLLEDGTSNLLMETA